MNEISISNKLLVNLPEGLDLTFQVLPDFSETEEIICRWSEDDLQYALMADDQPGGMGHDEYWNSLLNEMGKDGAVDIVASGEYKNTKGYRITYKAMKVKSDGEETNQLMHLIVGEKVAYWVVTIFVSSINIFQVNSEVRTIISGARLIDESS